MSYMIREVKAELRRKGFNIDTKRDMHKIENQLIVGICICEVYNFGDHRYSDSFLRETLEYYYIDFFEFHRVCDKWGDEYVYLVYKNVLNGTYDRDIKNINSLNDAINHRFINYYLNKMMKKINKAIV